MSQSLSISSNILRDGYMRPSVSKGSANSALVESFLSLERKIQMYVSMKVET